MLSDVFLFGVGTFTNLQGGAKNIDLNDQEQLKKITVQAVFDAATAQQLVEVPLSQATGVCSWRAEGIKHRKNEAQTKTWTAQNPGVTDCM